MPSDNVEVKVSADDSEVGRGLSGASQKVRSFASTAENEAQKVDKAWQQASKNVGKYMLGMSASIAAGFGASAKVSATYDQNLRNVNTMAGLTEKGLKGLSGEILKLSQSDRITKGPRELSGALYEIYGAGLKGKEAMATLAVAAKAADVGLTDVNTAASPLVQTMIAFHASADRAAQIGDVLAKTVEIGRIRFEDLNQSIGPVMSRAAAFGVSVEEVGAAMAVLSQTMPAAEASTALERLMTAMAAPTTEAAAAMDKLGIAYGRTELQSKGLIGKLEEIRQKTGESDLDFRKLLHSSEALQAGLALVSGEGQRYKSALVEMGNAHGTLDKQLTEQLKGAEKQWAQFMKQAELAAVQAGTVILPIATKALGQATSIIRAFSDLSPETQKFVVAATGVAGGFTAMAGGMFLLAPALANAPQAFRNVRIAGAAVAIMTRGLLGPLAAAALAVTALYEAWEHNWLGMRQITIDSANAMNEAMTGLKMPGFDKEPEDRARELRARRNSGQLASGPQILGFKPPKNNTGLHVTFTGPTHAPKWSDLRVNPPQSAPPPKPPVGPIRVQQTGGGGSEIARIKEQERAAKEAARLAKKRQSAEDQELKLRLKYLESMKDLLGKSTEEIRKASGGVGDSFNQCANTVRLGAKNMGEAFPVAKNPYDKNKLRPGEGIGAAHADSLFSAEVGRFYSDRSKAKIGDLAFFDSPDRPGVVQHVGTVSGPGRMIDASSGQGKVVERGFDSLGSSRRLMGFISPAIFDKSKKGQMSGADYAEEWRKREKELDEKWKDIQGQYLDQFDKELADLDQADKEALETAPSKEAYDKVHAAIAKRKMQVQADAGMSEEGPGGQSQSILTDLTQEMDRQNQLIELSKERWNLEFEMAQRAGATDQEQRAKNIELYQERLNQIQGLSQLSMASEQSQNELLLEKQQLEQQIWSEQAAQADIDLQRKLEQFDLDAQLGELDTERKIEWLNRELVAFTGSEQMRQNLLQQRRALETQMQMEQWQMADSVYQAIDQSFNSMLSNALSRQGNFNQIFQNLWKQVAQSILSELAKMLIKALALQSILRGIFGFFGGIFGGIGGIGAGGLDLGGGALAIAHTGGFVVPGGIQSFHTGGLVGGGPGLPNFSPDEVIAKLQTGEMVLSRQMVSNLSDLDVQDGRGFDLGGVHFHGDIHVKEKSDIQELSRQLGLEITRRLQGKV